MNEGIITILRSGDGTKTKIVKGRRVPFVNAMINPAGEIFEVSYMGHEEFAGEYLLKLDRFDDKGHESSTDFLTNNGWMRVQELDYNVRYIAVHPKDKKFPKRQINALMDLCNKYEREFPQEILER